MKKVSGGDGEKEVSPTRSGRDANDIAMWCGDANCTLDVRP